MARFEFTVPTLAPPLDQRVRLDTAADNSGSSVTDVLIGGRVADPAQGFDLRGVATFLGPDGVDTLYLKALNYRGKVIGASIELTGAASGGSAPTTVVHSFDVAADASGINTALVAGVNTGIVIPAGSVVMPYGLTLSVPANWDGSSPTLGLATSQADLLSQTNSFQQPLTSSADVPLGLGNTAVFPSGGVGSDFSANLSAYFPADVSLWVGLYDSGFGPGTDPGSTTGTAKLLVAYTPPAA